MDKNLLKALVIMFILALGFFSILNIQINMVKEVGLKNIIESIWEGENETKKD